ncbi:protein containing Transcriptional regulator PadR [mine drainage metagenome]|uniref:Protein containing Transcriptional regulator PadR n=1 Tax=mine drainage metagenome TaxID=410659 RepID=T1A2P8_9ZZZZ
MYALSVMAREGPVHGYGLSERIAQRTEGTWRPGPGAVYPALRRLEELGFAVGRREGARRRYAITARGRALLRQLAARRAERAGSVPDTTVLWMEIVGESDRGRYLLRHLRRHLDQAARYAESLTGTPAGVSFVREADVEFERFRSRAGRAPRRPPRDARGGRA